MFLFIVRLNMVHEVLSLYSNIKVIEGLFISHESGIYWKCIDESIHTNNVIKWTEILSMVNPIWEHATSNDSWPFFTNI